MVPPLEQLPTNGAAKEVADLELVKGNANVKLDGEVVLKGMSPELYWMHANPNCINEYGYFALHEAAERFSVDMIKLLLRHGASANVRTVGNNIIENLLPLHVAVENTCLHKYLEDNLEDNLSHSQNPLDYIYKLIHLLCLPEMKIFLDTTRLLAEKTNNLLQELWNYIEDGKLLQSAVLLLAAQEQIRRGSSPKINDSSKKNGFDIINNCIVRLSYALRLEKGSHGMTPELLEERKTLFDYTWLLVDVISMSVKIFLHTFKHILSMSQGDMQYTKQKDASAGLSDITCAASHYKSALSEGDMQAMQQNVASAGLVSNSSNVNAASDGPNQNTESESCLLNQQQQDISFAILEQTSAPSSGQDKVAADCKVPHAEVFQHVSSILKEYGFCPPGDSMDTLILQPYDCRKSDGESNGESCKDANMSIKETANPDGAEEKVKRYSNLGLV
ncbi:hypothetical protein ZWY2020_043122 [Hordeum vulgare]|nr:hypothetical protein ZWY2020_043122 [Hordeum vulgare]